MGVIHLNFTLFFYFRIFAVFWNFAQQLFRSLPDFFPNLIFVQNFHIVLTIFDYSTITHFFTFPYNFHSMNVFL